MTGCPAQGQDGQIPDVLGLPLPLALERLAARGILNPRIVKTTSPRRPPEEGGLWRVLKVSEGGRTLVCGMFREDVAAPAEPL